MQNQDNFINKIYLNKLIVFGESKVMDKQFFIQNLFLVIGEMTINFKCMSGLGTKDLKMKRVRYK